MNQIDIAPRYAGILTGVTNTIGQIFQYFFYYMFGIMYQYKVIVLIFVHNFSTKLTSTIWFIDNK